MNKTIYDYLIKEELEDFVINNLVNRLSQHPEICEEFKERIAGLEPVHPVSVYINGESFTANKLMEYPSLSKLYKAYSYLVFLKDDPEYAFIMLKQGLPLMD